MKREIEEIVLKISECVDKDDFLDIVEPLVDELSEIDLDGVSIDSLLRIIEENPEVHFGMPGPIVHFLEKFYRNGYEERLVASVRRAPVPHNIWMLNRVINGSEGDVKLSYVHELDLLLNRQDISTEARDAASGFRSLLKS